MTTKPSLKLMNISIDKAHKRLNCFHPYGCIKKKVTAITALLVKVTW